MFHLPYYGGLLLFIPQRYNTTIKEVGQHEKAVVQLDSRPLKIKKNKLVISHTSYKDISQVNSPGASWKVNFSKH